jgi:hypothetical protein
MTETNKQLLEQPQLQLRMCPSCFRFAAFSYTFFDVRENQTVRIYECRCGEKFAVD